MNMFVVQQFPETELRQAFPGGPLIVIEGSSFARLVWSPH